MYKLPYFQETDQQVVKDFARAHPFVLLTGADADGNPVVTQVPVFIDERDGKWFLSGHLMKNTDHHKAFLQNPKVLAVFTGPHTYVSASWYEDKQQGSTWNYMSVHARGKLRFLEEKELRLVLERTTAHFEGNPHSGANYHDLPTEYVDKLIKAIVAFEVEVEHIENVFKLSQNRDAKSYENIIAKLEQQGGDGAYIADQMKMRKSQLFKEHGE